MMDLPVASTASIPPTPTTSSPGTGALGRYFSYFSHRVFVTYRPVDLHEYLKRLFRVEPKPGTAGEFDAEILRWVLLHRARLNPLMLNREIEALRDENDELLVPAGMAEMQQHRIDVTLQYAVERALGPSELRAWIERRPRMRQPLLDAAYYVSACFERDQTQEVRGGSGSDLLDLTSDGRDAFRTYLLQRMNLYTNESPPEDEKEKLRWEQEREAICKRALPEQDVRRLFVVACEVARIVAFETSTTALSEAWAKLALKEPSALSQPSKDLYFVLLLGPGPGLRILVPQDAKDPECMRFRWTFRPSGEASPDRERNEIVDEGRDLARRWDAIGHVLNLAARGVATVSVDDDDLLRRMMERYHLMRLSPGQWATLSASAKTLHKPPEVLKQAALLDLVGRLREFVDKADARSVIESTCLALICAAAMEGLAGRSTPSDGLEDGLDAVARGLRLDACQSEEAASRMAELHKQVAKLCDEPLPSLDLDADARWPDAKVLQESVTKAFAAGKKKPAAIDDEIYWRAVADRVRTSFGDPTQTMLPPAAVSAEICGWLARDPSARLVDLDLSRMTLRRWSTVLRHILMAGSEPDNPPPPWMAVHALERLGARNLNADAQQALLDRLEAVFGLDKRIREELGDNAWRGALEQSQAALVVVSVATSVTDAWSVPPAAGLVVVATAPEAAALLASVVGPALLRSFTSPLQLAIEHPAPTAVDLASLETQLKVWAIVRGTTCWIYREGQAGGKVPRLVGPTSPADLWSTAAGVS